MRQKCAKYKQKTNENNMQHLSVIINGRFAYKFCLIKVPFLSFDTPSLPEFSQNRRQNMSQHAQ